MTAQAPAILDVRLTGAGQSGRAVSWLSGIGVRQVRLACGLVMFTYVFSHFFNHALGNISYATMEAWLDFLCGSGASGSSTTLYTAAFTHFMLGLWAL
jgi:adenylate cyclase